MLLPQTGEKLKAASARLRQLNHRSTPPVVVKMQGHEVHHAATTNKVANLVLYCTVTSV